MTERNPDLERALIENPDRLVVETASGISFPTKCRPDLILTLFVIAQSQSVYGAYSGEPEKFLGCPVCPVLKDMAREVTNGALSYVVDIFPPSNYKAPLYHNSKPHFSKN